MTVNVWKVDGAPGPQELGAKAEGLRKLPPPWVPESGVIASNTVRWLCEASEQEALAVLSGWIRSFATEASELIVRSSSPEEGLSARGALESVRCQREEGAVLDAVVRVANDAKARSVFDLALVVQPYIAPQFFGHLSNERRVSRRRRDWSVEATETSGSYQALGFRVARRREGEHEPLLASGLDELRDVLRVVARALMARDRRYHCEWVWDGQRLYVTQADPEVEVRRPRPGGVEVPTSPMPSAVFTCLRRSKDSTRGWHKVACLDAFEQAGLPAADLLVLDDPAVLKALAAGELPPELLADLQALDGSLMVVRTDQLTASGDDPVMLPRTDALNGVDELSEALRDGATTMASSGVPFERFAFLLHRFIPARSGAWALAVPGNPQVLVDATWGVPDGLMWFPHDSFQCDIRGAAPLRRRVRCKSEYIGYDSRGRFLRQQTGVPWDWRPSVEAPEVEWIASAARALADREKRPLEVMFFIGVDPRSGYAPILPWFVVYDVPELPHAGARDTYFFTPAHIVESRADLDRLRAELSPDSRAVLRLRPEVEAVHDRDFADDLVDLARDLHATVELEGSVLSHLYYMLKRGGVAVRPAEPFLVRGHRQAFGKLVRDHVPLRISRQGESARVYQADRDELRALLKRKAVEEAIELSRADEKSESLEEIADLVEVLETLVRMEGATMERVRDLVDQKRAERGGFQDGVVLLETLTPPLSATVGRPEALFDEVEGAGPVRDDSEAAEFKSAVRTRLEARGGPGRLLLPILPPGDDASSAHFVEMGDEAVAVIEYLGMEVSVTFRAKETEDSAAPPYAPGPEQIALFA